MTREQTIQKLKEVMKSRNTEDQALTLYQIACEVYPDILETYVDSLEENNQHIMIRRKTGHLRNLMREIRKTDDEFRWLCVLPPVKVNKKPYVEYRYLNIKASKTPELLSVRSRYWVKRYDAIIEGYKKAGQIEKPIAELNEWKSKRKKFNPEDEK